MIFPQDLESLLVFGLVVDTVDAHLIPVPLSVACFVFWKLVGSFLCPESSEISQWVALLRISFHPLCLALVGVLRLETRVFYFWKIS